MTSDHCLLGVMPALLAPVQIKPVKLVGVLVSRLVVDLCDVASVSYAAASFISRQAKGEMLSPCGPTMSSQT